MKSVSTAARGNRARTDTTLGPFDPLQPGFQADCFERYRRYREADPVHWGAPAVDSVPGSWYVFSYEEVTSVLQDDRFGKLPPGDR